MVVAGQLNARGYPPELFNLPENFITDETLRTMHAEVCVRLLRDQPDADALDLLMIERVATSYFFLRQFEHDASERPNVNHYKSLTRTWLEIATELRKKRLEALSEVATKEKVAGIVAEALNSAIYGLEPAVARTVRERMTEALEAL